VSLLSINDVTGTEIQDVLDTTVTLGERLLNGRTVANLFYEPSTRTRLSFELAARKLGADVITFDVNTSAEQKGEGLKDTALTLQALGVDVLVVRHSEAGVPKFMSDFVNCTVINAGDGTHEHPTQALLDLYTMREHFGRVAGLRVGIVGDVRHSRVAHSLYLALAKMGAETTLIGPRKLVSSRPGRYVSYDLDGALPTLDVCYMLRYQGERHKTEYSPRYEYRLTVERAAKLPVHAVVMHPGPMNRGVEIDSDVADGPRSLIQQQVTNGVVVRAALLYWLENRRNG
jgi:aspartate carbamoyltransferase catalytic subunit